MADYIAIPTQDKKFQHFKVESEVAIYIKQLEHYIKYPNESKLKEAYPHLQKDKQFLCES